MYNTYNNMPPGIYNIRQDERKQYYLQYKRSFFTVPKHIYGNMLNNATHFWKTFTNEPYSMGVMLTGASGLGKTQTAEILCNMALNSGMMVVVVTELKADMELVQFIGSLKNAVILFDEYGKIFPIELQEKSLSMLSDISTDKKLYIMTDNDINYISRYIRDRPSRIRYHINFVRLSEDVFLEYCADHNIDKTYYNDLYKLYKKSPTFSFDHLSALVKEHIIYPHMSLEEVLDILNLEVLRKSRKLTVTKVWDLVTDKEAIPINYPNIDISAFNNGGYIYMRIEGPDHTSTSIRLSIDDVIDVTDDTMTAIYDKKYRIELKDE